MRVKSSSVEPIRVGQEALEGVDSFTYLGSTIYTKRWVTADNKALIGKARQGFSRLKPVKRASNLRKKTNWGYLTPMSNLFCYMAQKLGVWQKWTRETPDLYEQESVTDVIRKRKCGWLGHILRRPQDHVTRRALHWNPQGKRSRGRPAHTWWRLLEAEIRERTSPGLNSTELQPTETDGGI